MRGEDEQERPALTYEDLERALISVLEVVDTWTYPGNYWGAWQEGNGPSQEEYFYSLAAEEIKNRIASELGQDWSDDDADR